MATISESMAAKARDHAPVEDRPEVIEAARAAWALAGGVGLWALVLRNGYRKVFCPCCDGDGWNWPNGAGAPAFLCDACGGRGHVGPTYAAVRLQAKLAGDEYIELLRETGWL